MSQCSICFKAESLRVMSKINSPVLQLSVQWFFFCCLAEALELSIWLSAGFWILLELFGFEMSTQLVGIWAAGLFCVICSATGGLALLFLVGSFVGQLAKVNQVLKSQPRKIQLWKYRHFSRWLQIRTWNGFYWSFLNQELTDLGISGKICWVKFYVFPSKS